MNNYETTTKDPSGQQVAVSDEHVIGRPTPKVFVVCDQGILRRYGVTFFDNRD